MDERRMIDSGVDTRAGVGFGITGRRGDRGGGWVCVLHEGVAAVAARGRACSAVRIYFTAFASHVLRVPRVRTNIPVESCGVVSQRLAGGDADATFGARRGRIGV